MIHVPNGEKFSWLLSLPSVSPSLSSHDSKYTTAGIGVQLGVVKSKVGVDGVVITEVVGVEGVFSGVSGDVYR